MEHKSEFRYYNHCGIESGSPKSSKEIKRTTDPRKIWDTHVTSEIYKDIKNVDDLRFAITWLFDKHEIPLMKRF